MDDICIFKARYPWRSIWRVVFTSTESYQGIRIGIPLVEYIDIRLSLDSNKMIKAAVGIVANIMAILRLSMKPLTTQRQ